MRTHPSMGCYRNPEQKKQQYYKILTFKFADNPHYYIHNTNYYQADYYLQLTL